MYSDIQMFNATIEFLYFFFFTFYNENQNVYILFCSAQSFIYLICCDIRCAIKFYSVFFIGSLSFENVAFRFVYYFIGRHLVRVDLMYAVVKRIIYFNSMLFKYKSKIRNNKLRNQHNQYVL